MSSENYGENEPQSDDPKGFVAQITVQHGKSIDAFKAVLDKQIDAIKNDQRLNE